MSIAAVLAAAGLFVAAVLASFRILDDGDSAAIAVSIESIEIAGPQKTVFDWSKDACEPRDIPDAPARAFRDSAGQVQLISSHYLSRREIGPDLGHLRHRCEVIMGSDYAPRPENFEDREWISSTYTFDGRTIFALVHNEYQGDKHPGVCPSGEYLKCWYNTITFARSDDGGRTYRQPNGPAKLVAAIPYRYAPDGGAYGLFSTSNIVYKASDRHYYTLARVGGYGLQRHGSCLIRTRHLGDPASWRGWDGEGFGVRFIDPYREQASPVKHLCEPVASSQIDGMSMSLTWNTYAARYLLVGHAGSYSREEKRWVNGIYYSLSPDLIRWSKRKLLREVEAPWTFECGDRPPVAFPSVLDPTSKSRNFETTGRRPWLFITRFHYSDCRPTLNRDLIRVPLELSK